MKRIDRPSDCSLAFAIPLTRTDFLADLEAGKGKEYVRLFQLQVGDLLTDEVWARYEKKVVEPCLAVSDYSEKAGVLVERKLTRTILKTLIQNRRVMSIFAHWHAAGFTEEVVAGLPSLPQEVRDADGVAARRMGCAIKDLAQDLPNPSEKLAKLLNTALRSAPLSGERIEPGTVFVMNDPEQVLECNYEVVRNEFPHWHLKPSSMELADGPCTADEIRAFLGRDYSGTWDLRMCRSKFLGEGLKRTAPRIRVLMNQWPVTPGVQALFYKYTIQVLSAGGDDFPGASNSLHESFSRRFA